MRRVFCKAEDPKQTIDSFARRLHEKYKIPADMIVKDLKKNEIECGYYNIHFCKEREWEILSTTRPGSGYLTIPYNRLLLSKNGVLPEECKLNNLFKIVAESYAKTESINPAESFEAVEKPAVMGEAITPNTVYKIDHEDKVPVLEKVERHVHVDASQVEDQAATVNIPKKVQFNI